MILLPIICIKKVLSHKRLLRPNSDPLTPNTEEGYIMDYILKFLVIYITFIVIIKIFMIIASYVRIVELYQFLWKKIGKYK